VGCRGSYGALRSLSSSCWAGKTGRRPPEAEITSVYSTYCTFVHVKSEFRITHGGWFTVGVVVSGKKDDLSIPIDLRAINNHTAVSITRSLNKFCVCFISTSWRTMPRSWTSCRKMAKENFEYHGEFAVICTNILGCKHRAFFSLNYPIKAISQVFFF
jgi:hypothetical protein